MMRCSSLILGALCLMLAAIPAARSATQSDADLVTRGQYLARLADCEACHTAPGGVPFAGGRPFTVAPMGTIYSSNITPDTQYGIGQWTDAQFVRSVRRGISPHWKHLFPAMPYQDYARMSPDDVRAIRAYLATVRPVARKVPVNTGVFQFNIIRPGMFGWDLFNGPSSSYPDDPKQSAAWNRGRWLVEGPGHCAECHSPRTLTMGVSHRHAYAGAVAAGWLAYNLTSDPKSGIGSWTDEALATYLTTGHADGHGTAAGPMAEAISYSLRFMTKEDTAAMVTYLRSIPAQPVEPPKKPSGAFSPAALKHGETLFAGACAGCHLDTGIGRQVVSATIAGGHTLRDPDGLNLLQVLIEGSKLTTATGNADMPRFGGGYSDRDLADIAAYTMMTLGGTQPAFDTDAVKAARKGG
ncbi:MAG: c-type cytochrome [Gluconacetobacter sp.]